MSGSDLIVVLTTCASEEQAVSISEVLVAESLAACVQRQRIESIYRWQGEVCRDAEWLLLVKTCQRLYPAIEQRIRSLHSYELPEIIALPVVAALPGYRAWVAQMTTPQLHGLK